MCRGFNHSHMSPMRQCARAAARYPELLNCTSKTDSTSVPMRFQARPRKAIAHIGIEELACGPVHFRSVFAQPMVTALEHEQAEGMLRGVEGIGHVERVLG